MKTCKKCGQTKPLDDFYRTQAICKGCSKAKTAIELREKGASLGKVLHLGQLLIGTGEDEA